MFNISFVFGCVWNYEHLRAIARKASVLYVPEAVSLYQKEWLELVD